MNEDLKRANNKIDELMSDPGLVHARTGSVAGALLTFRMGENAIQILNNLFGFGVAAGYGHAKGNVDLIFEEPKAKDVSRASDLIDQMRENEEIRDAESAVTDVALNKLEARVSFGVGMVAGYGYAKGNVTAAFENECKVGVPKE